VDEYRRLSEEASKVWMDHGALEYRECVGDDLDIEGVASFRKAAGTKEGETVIFSWIVYESREKRDEVNAAVMEDPRLKEMMGTENTPFDHARMAYGGFRTIVEA